MINWFLVGFLPALWLGILTSISPCPLATNIAAVSFLSNKIINPKVVFVSAFVYTLGRMFSYAALGWIIISSILSVPVLANLLQKYMNRVFGPLLILSGLVLLDILKVRFPKLVFSKEMQGRIAAQGMGGAFVLGLIFALVFCPISAALFFGSLIPLALESKFGAILPFVYGIGTGLPVLLFAVGIALSVKSLSLWFNRVAKLEYCMRKITGGIFIAVGLYYIGIYWLKIF
jgi:cytochrome c biogenesis protein CcdA